MLFLINVLVMNGGTTFLVRMARYLSSQGVPVCLLVFTRRFDERLLGELEEVASVLWLPDYCVWKVPRPLELISVLFPIRWNDLLGDLKDHLSRVHVMSVFGLFLMQRFRARSVQTNVSIGVYHQNEFMFRTGSGLMDRLVGREISRTGSEGFVFFNESTRDNYGAFFEKDLADSVILPIGIVVEKEEAGIESRKTPPHPLIISLGNLDQFKTYNRNVIGIMPELVNQFPDLSYHIYGEGSEREGLEQLVRKLGLEDSVRFMGQIDYSELKGRLAGASVFVGSGTAILEAASLGVPSIIGIESIQEPMTYGFIYDVPSYSYNELGIDIEMRPIQDLMRTVFSDDAAAARIGQKCYEKACKFDISVTAEGLLAIEGDPCRKTVSKWQRLGQNALILIACVIDRVGIDRSFSTRHSQGSLGRR